MRTTLLFGAGIGVAALLAAPPAPASSLPPVDFGDRPTVGVGLGAQGGSVSRGPAAWRPGGSLSVDWPIGDDVAVGVALGSTFSGGATFDVRGVYRFIPGGPDGPSIAGIVGLWGVAGAPGTDPRFTLPVPLAPAIGFGLAYAPMDKLTLRLNLAYSPFFTYGLESLGFIGGPPASGLEVAYALSPGFSVTAGLNGNGDLLGAKYAF